MNDELDVERLARAMVAPDYPSQWNYPLEDQDPAFIQARAEWDTDFEWHRSEYDLDKARAAALRIAAEYARLASPVDPHEGPTPRDCPECIRLHG